MLLLHTVLAVVYGGLLVSARPDPLLGRDWDAEDSELADANHPSYHVQHGALADFDDAWEWTPEGPQHILGTHAEGFDDQEAIHFPGEPHYPPHPGPPGPPPVHVPPKERPPHFPHPPHFPKPGHDTKDKTVYQLLEGHPKFSRLFKLVNFTEDVTNYLNDSSQSVTLFALPNSGFPKPRHHPGKDEDILFEDLFQTSEGDLGDMLAAAEGYLNSARKPDEDRIKAFIKYVLLYNILPETTPLHELAKNNSFATSLKLPDGSLDGEPLRVRVGKSIGFDPRPSVNIFSKVLVPDIPAKNGVIHVVNKPILPPPSIFQIGFLFSDAFSTFTSALQRVGLTDELDFRNVEDGSIEGSPAVSVFAPSNKAFSRLPPKLKLFLFSPFGEKALKKLLQFHIVPEAVLHSDYYHNASHSEFVSSRDNSETGEFYAHLDHHPEDWLAIFEEPSKPDRGYYNDQDVREDSAWRAANLNSGSAPSWENDDCQRGHGPLPPLRPHGGAIPHEASREGAHFPYPGDARHPPQHHGPYPWPPPPSPPPQGGPHHAPRYPPPPPEVWVHYPAPPPPPQNGPSHPPHYPPPPPPEVWLHYPPLPPPPQGGSHHPPHFPPPPPPFEDRPRHPPHHPPPPPPPHGPHGPPHFPLHPPGKLPNGRHPHHRPEVVYSVNATVPTLLEKFPLNVKVVQVAFKGPHQKPTFYKTVVIAHGQPVAVPDIPARNGAIHVITKLLNPFKKPGHHHGHEEDGEEPRFRLFDQEEDEWAGWEEWLPRWAEEQD
ncbi:FAS1 domain-containing protein [Ganoderma leucocontextum]|nr:FAS1 domain-containing protein [Ganoderma leucocontextum]